MNVRTCLGGSARVLGIACRRYSQRRAGRRAAMADASGAIQQALVRSVPGENELTIHIVLGGTQRAMRRDKDEPLEKTLARIQMNALGKEKKRRAGVKTRQSLERAAAADPPPRMEVQLLADASGGGPLPPDTPNEQAWLHGRTLRVGSALFSVVLNPPMADKLTVHGQPFLGIPLCPVPELRFADEAACEWAWEARDSSDSDWRPLPGGRARVLTPGPELAACGGLRVTCTPARQTPAGLLRGAPVSAELPPPRNGPPVAAGAGRHELTRCHVTPPGLRIVTYNLLADQYAGSEHAKKHLFYYCPPQFRYPDYRRPQALQELLGFHADILCLQEVDEKAFWLYFQPQLAHAGYEGHYSGKAGATKEGSALFWRRARFRLVQKRDLPLKRLFGRLLASAGLAAAGEPAGDESAGDESAAYESAGDESAAAEAAAAEAAAHAQLLPFLAASRALRRHLLKVSTVAQLAVLAPADDLSPADSALCLVNTHLFFHPGANHIRSLHTAAIVTEAVRLAEACAAAAGGRRPALLFCGDLNSGLNKGVPGALELLASGQLPGSYWDWEAGRTFRYQKGDAEADDSPAGSSAADSAAADAAAEPAAAQSSAPSSAESALGGGCEADASSGDEAAAAAGEVAFTASDLRLPLRLQPANGLQTLFTNFVAGYSGALDYVWYEPRRMRVTREVPLPHPRELAGWLPSQRFPSDHLSVVFDLEWRQQPAGERQQQPQQQPQLRDAASMRVFPATEASLPHGVLALQWHGVVAVPTDTLYGLAGSAEDEEAIQRLYDIKQRPAGLPLAICVAAAADVPRYGEAGHLPPGLLQQLLPGPVTLLLRRRAGCALAPGLNPGVETVGIRVPDCAFMQQLCAAFGSALALTSANLSGQPSSLAVADFRGLWPRCGAIFDGGPIPESPAGSTIVDLTQPGSYRIVRDGVALAATEQRLRAAGLQPAAADS